MRCLRLALARDNADGHFPVGVVVDDLLELLVAIIGVLRVW